jgi:alginate O-acetyltransferase complex protein AlgI
MLFTSPTFVIFFAIAYVAYAAARRYSTLAAQNTVLAVASLVFYGWWDYRYVSLLLFSCAINYLAATKIDRSATDRSRRTWLVLGVGIQLMLLGIFKYLAFVISNVNVCLSAWGLAWRIPPVEMTLPVGISFYTFQAIGYTIDVYRRTSPVCRSIVDFILFVSFFPQLVAGPIETSHNLLAQVERPRVITFDRLNRGLYWVLIGLYQKVVVADTLAPMVEHGFDNVESVSGISSLFALVAFSLQIYGDFAGYTSIARGLGEWMGFSLVANFRRPYLADSPRDFWRRWHISLSQWLRDYLYISLGGNRRGVLRTLFNLMATMILGGLWHGAAWNFIIWGAYHGSLLCANHLLAGWPSPGGRNPRLGLATRIPRVVGMYVLTLLGWLLFRVRDMNHAKNVLHNIFTNFTFSDEVPVFIVPVFALGGTMLAFQCLQESSGDDLIVLSWPAHVRWIFYAFIVSSVCVVGFSATPFIYFQF